MPDKEVITAADGLKSPLLSQAIKYGDTIYVSGNVGMDFTAMKMVEGSVSDRTVCMDSCRVECKTLTCKQKKALENIEIVLKEAGSSLNNLLKVRALSSAGGCRSSYANAQTTDSTFRLGQYLSQKHAGLCRYEQSLH